MTHKFIVDIAEDILPATKFVLYLKQDQIFLESFCKLLATASRIVNDNQTKAWFESLLDSTTRYEMPMQLEILNKLEDNDRRSAGIIASKITKDYVSYLKRITDSCHLSIILSAMAPCPWTYYEISSALVAKNIKSEAFKKWIRFYSSKESQKQVTELKRLLDRLGENSDKKKKIDMRNYFSISCNRELEFWNMVYCHI